jgi:hypothetical protein
LATASYTLATNDSPVEMSSGFSSEAVAYRGSTRLNAGSAPAAASA